MMHLLGCCVVEIEDIQEFDFTLVAISDIREVVLNAFRDVAVADVGVDTDRILGI